MKQTISMLCCLLCFASSQAQNTYDSLVVEGAHWFVENALPSTSSYNIPTDLYYLQGNTVINGKTYKNLYRALYGDNDPNTATASTYPIAATPYLSSYLREEDKKVYELEIGGTNEVLLYDFNLGQGDTGVFRTYTFTIDTVYQQSLWGTVRNVYECSSQALLGLKYIEGIGTIQSPINWWWQQNGSLLHYCRGTNNACNSWFTAIDTDLQSSFFSASPNPANDWITIEYENNQLQSLSIYDLQGKKIKDIALDNSGKQTISLENISAGLYYWKINDSFFQKWLKND